jgi:hypothetical protein
MADSAAFTWVCNALEQATRLSELETRGTVRIALKSAGLESHHATPGEMAVVLEKVLPAELTRRAVENSAAVCQELATRLRSQGLQEQSDSTRIESVFRRLGGSTG